MKKLLLIACWLLVRSLGWCAPFTPGNIVVVRIGAGAAAMTPGEAQPVFLDEYTPTGLLVQTIALPTSVAGSNKRLTLPVSTADYSEGYISLSPDRQKLVVCGYDADVSTASVSATTSSTTRRVIGVIDANGTVNTSTNLNTFNTVVVRSATMNGNDIWVTGGSGGIMYTTLGSTTFTNVASTTGRCLDIYNGQLYATSAATGLRMATVGTGLPTTTGQTLTAFPGYPTSGSPYQFFLADLSATEPGLDVLYTADNNLLRKYSKVSGTWVDNGIIGTSADRYRGLAARMDGNNVILFAARKNDNTTNAGGEIVTFTDNTGYNASFAAITPTLVVAAPANTVFRGLAITPGTELLPVKLSAFTAQVVEKNVQLKWTTETEKNNAYFDVQRSVDARNFTTIGKVNAKGNTTSRTAYTFTDNHATSGKVYYRLQQVDKDGKVTTSYVLMVNTKDRQAAIKVMPATNQAAVELLLTANENMTASISITDMFGRLLAQKNLSLAEGTSRQTIEVPALTAGIYVATLTAGNGMLLNEKFMR
jgi:hypothetical protein